VNPISFYQYCWSFWEKGLSSFSWLYFVLQFT
jgi:hypothetical protein